MSLRDMKLVFRQEGFDEDFVRGAITELLQALDFLHTHGEVVHTGTVPVKLLFLCLCPANSWLTCCRRAPWELASGGLR